MEGQNDKWIQCFEELNSLHNSGELSNLNTAQIIRTYGNQVLPLLNCFQFSQRISDINFNGLDEQQTEFTLNYIQHFNLTSLLTRRQLLDIIPKRVPENEISKTTLHMSIENILLSLNNQQLLTLIDPTADIFKICLPYFDKTTSAKIRSKIANAQQELNQPQQQNQRNDIGAI